MTSGGILHTASDALACGLAVVLRPRGTRWHRAAGWAYVASMAGLFATACLTYGLVGRVGPFRWLAVVGAVTLLSGLAPVLLLRPRRTWIERHCHPMGGYSYLGPLAATGAEIGVRVPGAELETAAVAPLAGTSAGAVVIARRPQVSARFSWA